MGFSILWDQRGFGFPVVVGKVVLMLRWPGKGGGSQGINVNRQAFINFLHVGQRVGSSRRKLMRSAVRV